MNYYERHIGDYLKDTAHLSLLEHGIYSRLMDVYYTREKGLQQAEIARLIGARTKDEKAALEAVLTEFFILADGEYTQDRCEREISRYQKKAEHNRTVGKLGGRPKKTETQTKPSGLSVGSENEPKHNPPQYPVTSNQKPVTKNTSAIAQPDGVCDSVWFDFVAHRKAKKARLTQTAMDDIQAEAVKAGWSLENALREACTRGWVAFKADWVADKPNARAGPAETVYQRSMRERVDQMIGRNKPAPVIDVDTAFLEIENVPSDSVG